ncbi:hypothetical protein BSKO_10762 [Bryopsis sp. KO-2023]|nr:hypothetical protein BSKO_10762 [Bryopsis sp. KO-2023]
MNPSKAWKKKRIRKQQGDVVTDPRFSKLHSDPRFARFPAQKRKVKIDDRFSAVFSDPSFKEGARIDKWGRKVDPSKQNEEMERLYRLDGDEDKKSAGKLRVARGTHKEKARDAELEQTDEINEIVSEKMGSKTRKGKKSLGKANDTQQNIARGGVSKRKSEGKKGRTLTPEEVQHRADQVARMRGMLGGSSSEEMDSADEPLSEEEEGDDSDELDLWGVGAYAGNPEEEIPSGEATRRLAVVDLDWENIRAVDILNVMRSFLPTGGRIDKVSVLVSDYGKERMAAEDAKGPGALGVFGKSESEESDEDDLNNVSRGKKRRRGNEEEEEEDGGVDMERLRKYERSKLRYYYAVVECDSVEAAAHLVQELDGREFETSQCMFDMRYIPDEMEFDTNDCRDSAMEVPEDYEPPKFECNALTKTNVKLTWDGDDKQRTKVVRRKFTDDDLLDEDFKVYLASASEHGSDEGDEEGEDVEAIRARYKNLFGNFGENSDDSDSSSSSSDSDASGQKKLEDDDSHSDGSSMEAGRKKIRSLPKAHGVSNEEAVEGFDSLDEEGGEEFFETGEIDKEITFQVAEDQQRGKNFEPNGSSDEDEATKDTPMTDTKRKKSKKRGRDAGVVDGKSQADLELLLLDDDALKAARKGATAVEGKTGASGKGKKLSKKERIRLAKLRKEMSKQGSDEEDANDNDFQVDLSDSRFKGMFTSSEFAIDPTHPAFQRSRGAADLMKEVASEKSKKSKHPKKADISQPEVDEHANEKKGELQSMAEKLKRKSKLAAKSQSSGRSNKGRRNRQGQSLI